MNIVSLPFEILLHIKSFFRNEPEVVLNNQSFLNDSNTVDLLPPEKNNGWKRFLFTAKDTLQELRYRTIYYYFSTKATKKFLENKRKFIDYLLSKVSSTSKQFGFNLTGLHPDDVSEGVHHFKDIPVHCFNFFYASQSLESLTYLNISSILILSNCCNLLIEDLCFSSETTPLYPHEGIQKIKYLNIGQCSRLEQCPCNFQSLVFLDISGNRHFTTVQGFPVLEILNAYDCENLTEVLFCPNLKEFALTYNEKLSDLNHVKHVKKLILSQCSKIEDISLLSYTDIVMVEHLPHLTKGFLNDASIKSLTLRPDTVPYLAEVTNGNIQEISVHGHFWGWHDRTEDSFEVSYLDKSQKLNLQGTRLSSTSSFSNVVYLQLEECRVGKFDASVHLRCLTLKKCEVYETLLISEFPFLTDLTLVETEFPQENLTISGKLEQLHLRINSCSFLKILTIQTKLKSLIVVKNSKLSLIHLMKGPDYFFINQKCEVRLDTSN